MGGGEELDPIEEPETADVTELTGEPGAYGRMVPDSTAFCFYFRRSNARWGAEIKVKKRLSGLNLKIIHYSLIRPNPPALYSGFYPGVYSWNAGV